MYKEKYLKYKTKYLDLKSQLGGAPQQFYLTDKETPYHQKIVHNGNNFTITKDSDYPTNLIDITKDNYIYRDYELKLKIEYEPSDMKFYIKITGGYGVDQSLMDEKSIDTLNTRVISKINGKQNKLKFCNTLKELLEIILQRMKDRLQKFIEEQDFLEIMALRIEQFIKIDEGKTSNYYTKINELITILESLTSNITQLITKITIKEAEDIEGKDYVDTEFEKYKELKRQNSRDRIRRQQREVDTYYDNMRDADNFSRGKYEPSTDYDPQSAAFY